MNDDSLRETIKERYAQAARRVTAQSNQTGASSCCGAAPAAAGTAPASRSCGCASPEATSDPITTNLYAAGQTDGLPADAVAASLGCGNPTALADLKPGEIVLDLGSGGGIDVLLSARRVGPTGKAYGLDMTDEMLELAHRNQRASGLTNVEFLKGEMEHIPLPDNTVDVVISNCVINLSTDKSRVLSEAYRVLKPGGRFAVSDVVVRRPISEEIRRNVELWIGCLAGALEEGDFRAKLNAAGFEQVEIEPWRVYRVEDAISGLVAAGIDPATISAEVDGAFMSAFVRGRKPVVVRSGSGSAVTRVVKTR